MACGHDSFTFIWLLPVRACSRYSKKKSVTVSCLSISEKGDHTTQKSNYISGKWKELKFRKWSIKWCWNILTKSNLLRRNFLSNCTKKFSRGSMEDKSKWYSSQSWGTKPSNTLTIAYIRLLQKNEKKPSKNFESP